MADVKEGNGKWKKGICECFSNCGMCLYVFFCNPCTIGQFTSIAKGGSALLCLLVTFGILVLNITGDALEIASGTNLAMYAAGSVLIALSGLIACVAVCYTRAKYRERYDIPGNCCSDCLAATFCSACATCQHASQDEITACGGGERPYEGFWSPYANGVEPATAV